MNSDAHPASQPAPAGWIDAALLSFVAAFVDTACFIGLFGLFTAHVTGNFVLIGAALVGGDTAIVGKLLALPVFALAVAATALVSGRLRTVSRSPLAPLLVVQALLLAAAALSVLVMPAPRSGNDGGTLVIGMLAVVAMGLQNALMRLELSALPPTTVMTGNVTQVVIDLVAAHGAAAPGAVQVARLRIRKQAPGLLAFAGGAAAGALVFAWVGLLSLAIPALLCLGLAWRWRAA